MDGRFAVVSAKFAQLNNFTPYSLSFLREAEFGHYVWQRGAGEVQCGNCGLRMRKFF